MAKPLLEAVHADPSLILRKLAAYPRQNELGGRRPAALREIGRIECSLFMLDWTTDPGGRVPAQRDDT